MKRWALGFLALLLLACQSSEKKSENFDWQGHRGARGEVPENTVEAMIRALQEGVKTLEMDVVISKDSVVLLSHEPFFNEQICIGLEGETLSNGAPNNLFQLDYEEIKSVDCGSKGHPNFIGQEKFVTHKPTLLEVFARSEEAAIMINREAPYYNIEIKSRPEWDGVFAPELETYVDLVMEVVEHSGLGERVCIQSFDPRALKYLHNAYPQTTLAFLVERSSDFKEQLESLGFIPKIYSPNYRLLNRQKVKELQALGMKVIPWTVNEIEEAKALRDMGVDGIITDYPARLISSLGF